MGFACAEGLPLRSIRLGLANGNQTACVIGSDTYNLYYDAENRMIEVKKNSAVIAEFVYDGDSRRVKSFINGETTLFVGGHHEVKNPGSGQQVTKYYFAGASRIAMRQDTALYYLLSDHLGSTSVTTAENGDKVSEMRYTAWGEVRYSSGAALTKYKYTGQREESSFGLYFYNARWYDPVSGRFAQADTIVPGAGDVQAWDRYAYVKNSPINYTDPTGHWENETNDPLEEQLRNAREHAAERAERNRREREESSSGNNNPPTPTPSLLAALDVNLPTPTLPSPTGTPHPHSLTTVEKYGLGFTVALTEVVVVIPIETVLLALTGVEAYACFHGAVGACLADIPLTAADVVVADFGISLAMYAAESISNGYKGEFKWRLILPIYNSIKNVFRP